MADEDARSKVRFEEEVSCNISAGPNCGTHQGKVMASHQVDQLQIAQEALILIDHRQSQATGNSHQGAVVDTSELFDSLLFRAIQVFAHL
jgi:hypothetical protein